MQYTEVLGKDAQGLAEKLMANTMQKQENSAMQYIYHDESGWFIATDGLTLLAVSDKWILPPDVTFPVGWCRYQKGAGLLEVKSYFKPVAWQRVFPPIDKSWCKLNLREYSGLKKDLFLTCIIGMATGLVFNDKLISRIPDRPGLSLIYKPGGYSSNMNRILLTDDGNSFYFLAVPINNPGFMTTRCTGDEVDALLPHATN